MADIPDQGFDLVIMNPPFTRAGSDWEGNSRQEDYVKQFKGLSTDLVTQKDMAKQLHRYAHASCYHGYAGIASAFAALADKKLKPGGVLALVMPLSAAAGLSWQEFRAMMSVTYTETTVVSIAAADDDDLSFSADTGMAECLIIARKLKTSEVPDQRAHFASLNRRPRGFAHASAVAKGISDPHYVRNIEDGPYGGTSVMVGNELTGETLAGPCSPEGDAWSGSRLSDSSLGQTAFALSCSQLWLPGTSAALDLRIVVLSVVGERGIYDMNIAGKSPSAPFIKTQPAATATYPSLWNHDSKEETRLVCVVDSQLVVKPGMESKAAVVWATASRAHISRDFRFNSQPLGASFTEQDSIGGRAWPNVTFADKRFDYAFVIWSNSTLGLLSFWWHANRQVSGRGTTTISAVSSLPVLDFRTLRDEQLATAQTMFEEFRDKELQPAYLADADPNRALLDRRVVCDLLGFDEEVYRGVRRLADKWCAEPSVHGGKARPKDASLII